MESEDEVKILDDYADSMTIEFQYDPHSQLYDLINTGIELDLILSDDNEAASDERMQRVRDRVDNDNQEIHDLHKNQKD